MLFAQSSAAGILLGVGDAGGGKRREGHSRGGIVPVHCLKQTDQTFLHGILEIQARRGRGGGAFADGGHHACNEGGHSRFIAVLGQSQQVIGDFLHGASSGRQMRTPL